jgi:hypothetical protein
MARSTFSGPLKVGPVREGSGVNTGDLVLHKSTSLVQDGEATVDAATIKLPANSRIVDIVVDVTEAFDSATSATLTVGRTSAGTELASGVNAKTQGRVRPTFTTTQLTNMADISTNTSVIASVAAVGATTEGAVTIHVFYVQGA